MLLYGSETWTIKAKDARRITAGEMKYMRRTAGYTCTDYKTNTQIAKELKVTPILDKLLEYKRNWIQHVNRMPRNRLARIKKLRGLSPRANYTDRAAAAGRRSYCQLLRVEGCHVVSATGPHGR